MCACACALAAVFWGGPLWQVYHGLRTHACSVTVKGLRPSTAAEIERMHHDCAICWCPMTVPGACHQPGSAGQQQQQATAHGTVAQHGSTDNSPADTNSSAGNPVAAALAAGHAPAVPQVVQQAPGLAPADAVVQHIAAGGEAGPSGIAAVQQRQQQAGELSDTDGCTLPCGHCYHPGCLTQVRAHVMWLLAMFLTAHQVPSPCCTPCAT